MPALRMKRMFDGDGFANEFNTRNVKSAKVSHFHVSGLEQSAVLNSSDKAPQDESDPTIQLADQDIRVTEASVLHDPIGGKSMLKDLTSDEVIDSPNSEADSSANYDENKSVLYAVNHVGKDAQH